MILTTVRQVYMELTAVVYMYIYLCDGGSSLICRYTGHRENLEDRNMSSTPSVLIVSEIFSFPLRGPPCLESSRYESPSKMSSTLSGFFLCRKKRYCNMFENPGPNV